MNGLALVGIEFTAAGIMWGFFTDSRARALAMAAFGTATLALIALILLPRYFVLPLYFTPMLAILALSAQAGWTRFFNAYGWTSLFAAVWLAAPELRQTLYELRTIGYVTNYFGACMQQFVPMAVAVVTGSTVLVGMMLVPLNVPPFWQRRGIVVAAVVAVVAGVWGWFTWSGWQTGRPCF